MYTRGNKRSRSFNYPNNLDPFFWDTRIAGRYNRRRIAGSAAKPMSSTTMQAAAERRIVVGDKGKRNFTQDEILKQVNNILNPLVTFKYRCNTQNLETLSNQQAVHEFVMNGFDEVNLHFQKLLTQPPSVFTAASLPSTPQALAETRYVYEGGKYKYSFVNTATHTIYLELRVYGMKVKAVGHGVGRGSSPLNHWSYDELNDAYTGDTWFLESNLVNPTNSSASTISQIPITQGGYTRGNGYLNAYGNFDAMKRPKKSSPSLHRVYDLEKKTNLVVRPGETVHYEVLMPRFWLDGIRSVPTDSSQIERYTKFLWVMQRGEMVTDTSTDTPKMAPGSTQLTLSIAIEHNIRCPTLAKGNYVIESSNTGALRGGFDDILSTAEATINEETLAEQIYSEIGATNN